MKLIEFTPNQPQELRLGGEIKPTTLREGAGCLFTLQDGSLLHVSANVAHGIEVLGLQPGESFMLCDHRKGGELPYMLAWLSPETEKKRAKEETPELERQLQASLELVGRRRGPESMLPLRSLAPTGTEGPAPQLAPRKAAIAAVGGERKGKPGPIPANVAFGEILDFAGASLKDRGISWNDQAVQDFISTVWISGCKAGWITLWEREAA